MACAIQLLRVGDGVVHPLPRGERALDLRELRQHRVLRLAQQARDDPGLLEDILRMRRGAVIVLDPHVLVRLQAAPIGFR